jgi:hypothetical protein
MCLPGTQAYMIHDDDVKSTYQVTYCNPDQCHSTFSGTHLQQTSQHQPPFKNPNSAEIQSRGNQKSFGSIMKKIGGPVLEI